MREIKFRAWDESRRLMFQNVQNVYDMQRSTQHHEEIEGVDTLIYPSSFGSLLEDDDYIVMQFTGLTDRHGKEIWEGDIVFDDGGYKEGVRYMGIVTYGEWNGAPMFYSNTSIFGTPERLMLSKHTEVLGNIYEHSSLLTTHKESSLKEGA